MDGAGRIYAVSDYGTLRAYTPEGEWVQQFYLYGHEKASPAIGKNGLLYIPGSWTNFFGVRIGAGLAESSWPSFSGDAANTGRTPLSAND